MISSRRQFQRPAEFGSYLWNSFSPFAALPLISVMRATLTRGRQADFVLLGEWLELFERYLADAASRLVDNAEERRLSCGFTSSRR